MKNRGVLYFILFFSFMILVALYALMGFYYGNSFSYGTWINHVYCTGKTVEEVNQELKTSDFYSGIVVTVEDGERYFLDAETIGYNIDYTDELRQILARQNPLAWGLNFFTSRDRTISGYAGVDDVKLSRAVSEWSVFQKKIENTFEIRRGDDGYYLMENVQKEPVLEAFCQNIRTAVLNKEYSLNLENAADCYRSAKISPESMETKEFFKTIDAVQNQSITFKILDESFIFNEKDISGWIVTIDELNAVQDEESDDSNPGLGKFVTSGRISGFPTDYGVHSGFVVDRNGNPILRCSEIYVDMTSRCNDLKTEKAIEKFQSGTPTLIPVSGSKDGRLFDVNKEYENLLSALCSQEDQTFEISVPNKSFVLNSEELGDEYILVNMGRQKLSYYKDRKLFLEYDIVTGNTGRGRGTPVGFYHIYNKRYHTILRGADYASFVNYWLGVYKGIGVHDATWRREFGGEIYKKSGSHGCINSPLDKMEILYNEVEVGVPILLFY